MSFSRSCPEHYALDNPLIFGVARDPAGSPNSATETNVNCFICNQDQTARNMKSLSKKLGIPIDKWYATNAVMHGIHGDNKKPNSKTLKHCRHVLEEQIRLLTPRLIIGFGSVAHSSLYQIMPFYEPRSKFKEIVMDSNKLLRGPWEWINDSYIVVLPHPSLRGTNNIGGTAVRNELWNQLGLWIQDNIQLR